MTRRTGIESSRAAAPSSLVGCMDAATRHVAGVDPRMAELIALVGPCRLAPRRPRYAALVRAIVGQQVSTVAASTVYARLKQRAGGRVTATAVAGMEDSSLRGCGLSGRKVSYVRDLTERVAEGRLDLRGLDRLANEAVIASLSEVKGIGRWTAEMFLISVLLRGDVLPVDDLGIQNGFRKIYGLRARPTIKRMHQLARPWTPWRTIGSWYLWRSLDLKKATSAGGDSGPDARRAWVPSAEA